MAVVAPPAEQIFVEFLDHPFDCYTSPVAGQLPHSHLQSFKTLRGNASLSLFADYDAKPQKLASPGAVNFALGFIDLQFELAGNELADTVHYAKSRPLAANIDVAVVGIPNEAVTSSLKLPVKFVKNYVRQQWR